MLPTCFQNLRINIIGNLNGEHITRRNGFLLPLSAGRRDTLIVVARTQLALGLKMLESCYGTEDKW